MKKEQKEEEEKGGGEGDEKEGKKAFTGKNGGREKEGQDEIPSSQIENFSLSSSDGFSSFKEFSKILRNRQKKGAGRRDEPFGHENHVLADEYGKIIINGEKGQE